MARVRRVREAAPAARRRAVAVPAADTRRSRAVDRLIAAGVAAATLAAFVPALGNGLVRWDDDLMLMRNYRYRGLGWENLAWMWTTLEMGHYMPLTWMTLGGDYVVWGREPFGYHLTSVLFHAAAAGLLYFVAARLIAAALDARVDDAGVRAGAAVAAGVFAVHPLRVESVAWLSERRDVVSGAFVMLAVLAYVEWARRGRRSPRRYWAAFGCFVAALLAKAIVVTIPLVLCILDVYPLRRLAPGRPAARALVGLIREKTPFFAAAAVAGAIAVVGQRTGHAITPLDSLGLVGRIAVAAYANVFYLAKMVWPAGLSPLYELPEHLDVTAWPFMAAGAALLGLTVAAIGLRRRLPGLTAAGACYVIVLAPVSGLLHTGPQIAADRYTYLPSIAWAVAAGSGVALAWRRRGLRPAVVATTLAVLVPLGALTWRQNRYWRDSETLWRRATDVTPSAFAYAKLAQALLGRDDRRDALRAAREGVRLNPDSPVANAVLADALVADGAAGEAVEHARRAVRTGPQLASSHMSLGYALATTGALAAAIEEFQVATRLDPLSPAAYNNLGTALMLAGRADEAEAALRRAVTLNPEYVRALRNLGGLLEATGRSREAQEHLRRAEILDAAHRPH